MRVALLAGYKNGAIDQVMRALSDSVRGIGVDVDLYSVYAKQGEPGYVIDKTFSDYDMVHFGYFQYASFYEGWLAAPCTANVWHIPEGMAADYVGRMHRWQLDRVVVDDVMTLQQLGQRDWTSTTYIPIIRKWGEFKVLPPPQGEFTVGVFCNDYPYKRWEIVVEACKQVGVVCYAMVTKGDRITYDVDPMADVYAHCHVLASATFVDTDSLPLREALLCGRPVLTTRNDGIQRVFKHGVNGLYYDGSIQGLVAAIKECRVNYDTLVEGAKSTRMEDAGEIARSYVEVWKDVLEAVE